MMIDIIFDTETTGFPRWKSPSEDPRQPHLVQLAALVAKGDELIYKWDTIVKCPIEIPKAAADVHGITAERSQKEGIELFSVITKFDGLLRSADRAVCHNTSFDFKIMKYAYYRANLNAGALLEIPRVCTMLTAAPLLRLPGSRGYKWPQLQQAYRILVDPEGFGGAHSTDADTMACWKVLRELERRGVELL